MPQARYKQLVDAYAADIREGRLAPGTRLPTHRQLAASQGLALVTASRVYAELESMGLVSGETGRGTFVREPEWPTFLGTDTQTAAASMADLSFNYPSLPGQAEQLRAALRQLAQSGDLDALLRYQPHGGRPHERAVAAPSGHARTAGAGRARADRLRRPAWLAVAATALLRPGDVVAVDALTYYGFKGVAEAQRLELAPVPVSAEGPDLDALERLCRARRVRAIYCMPTLHNPLGWVLDRAGRERLVAIARRHDLIVIEDQVYGYLVHPQPAPLAAWRRSARSMCPACPRAWRPACGSVSSRRPMPGCRPWNG